MTRHTRRRYIAVNIDSKYRIEERDFVNALFTSFKKLYGEYGASQANIRLIEFDFHNKRAILRCSHFTLDQMKASIVTITELNGKKVSVHIQQISGTLKSLRRKIMNSVDERRL